MYVPVPKPLNTNTISEVNFQILDSNGNHIRFMGNDNLPVTIDLLLSRRLHKK
jgi:hypothetical protein